MRWHWLAGMTALILAHGTGSAQDARMDIGVLTCGLAQSEETPGASDTAPLRQTRELLCAFRPMNSGPEETYTGTLQSVGLDKELSEQRVMIWAVKGIPGTAGSPGQLQQIYAADLAANPGHSPPLIGETNISIVLQTMADAQAPAAADKRQQVTIAMIVLVTLRLKSTPT